MIPLPPFIALIIMGQIRVWGQEIIPNLKEQVIQAGTDLKLTCWLHPFTPGDDKTFWELPDSIRKFPELSDINNRLNKTIGPGPRESTMILSKARPEDTGIYRCTKFFDPRTDLPFSKRYVYVTSNEKLIFMDIPRVDSDPIVLRVQKGQDLLIPCKPTHPDVIVSLIPGITFSSQFTPNELEEMWLTDKRFVREPTKIPLNGPNSSWTFDPTEGIKLKDAKISDSGYFVCQGEMNNVTNHVTFLVDIRGVEVERIGDPSDPTEGSDISFICRTIGYVNPTLKWFYQNNDTREIEIDKANPPKGINVTTKEKDNFKTIRLDIFGISRRETPTTFRCESYEAGETFSDTISFQIRANVIFLLPGSLTPYDSECPNLSIGRAV